MAEQEVATETQEAPPPSLEDIASEFQVQETPPPQREEPSYTQPNFESQDDALKWLANEHSRTRQQLDSLSSQLKDKEADEWRNDQMSALEDAIKVVGTEVGDLDPMFIEGALHTIYNRDANFQKIFNNRKQNPSAYKKALNVIAGQVKSKMVGKHDPDAAEGQRAMENLQKSSRTGRSEPENKYASMSAAEFDRAWESLKSGY